MSTLGTTQDHLTVARVNGYPVRVPQAHRFPGERYGPALVTVLAPVTLDVEDVAALLVDWMSTGGTSGELDDDATVRYVIADSVLNAGCLRVDEANATVDDAGEEGLLAYCRARATTVFASSTRGEWAVPNWGPARGLGEFSPPGSPPPDPPPDQDRHPVWGPGDPHLHHPHNPKKEVFR